MPAKVVAACLLIFLSTNLAADEIAIPLPKEGAWARYHVKNTLQPPTHSETIRIVADVRPGEHRHRWVESSFGSLEDGHRAVMKTRVSERDLKSAWPLADNHRWWHKVGDDPVHECDTFGPEYAVFSLVFPGPYKTANPLKEARTVEYQRGRLEIPEGLTGRQEISFKTDGHDIAFTMDYAVWRHADVPLGVAAAKVSLRTIENGQTTTYKAEYVLEDYGTDAKTALPENN